MSISGFVYNYGGSTKKRTRDHRSDAPEIHPKSSAVGDFAVGPETKILHTQTQETSYPGTGAPQDPESKRERAAGEIGENKGEIKTPGSDPRCYYLTPFFARDIFINRSLP